MAVKDVMRAGHVQLRVLDMEKSVHYYTQIIGLWETGRDEQGRVYLKAWDEHDHHSVVLRETDHAGLDFVGFKVCSNESLERLSAAVQKSGLATDMSWVPAGEHLQTGKRFRFTIPTGHVFELYAEKGQVGNMLPITNPDPWPEGLRGMSPSRMDHTLLYGDDVDGSVKLLTEVLGFSLAERMMTADGKIMTAFLACGSKPHDVAFVRYPEKGKLHHLSFYLDNWYEVLKAGDLISKNRVSLDIGPTRHGFTRGSTIYFFDPSGNRNEVYSGGYIFFPDMPTLTWTEEEVGAAIFYIDRKLNERFLTVVT